MATTAKEVTWWYRQSGIQVQFTVSTERNLLIPDSSVTKICAHELTSAIYCIAWTFFSLQQAKTCNSHKYIRSNWMGGLHKWCLNLPIDISVMFVPWYHMWKGTRLSPSLPFVVVVLGRAWERGYSPTIISPISSLRGNSFDQIVYGTYQHLLSLSKNLAIPGKQKHLIWTLSSGSGCTLVQSVNWGQLPLASVAIVWLSSDNSIIQVSFSTRGGKTDHRECWWTPVTVQMIIWLTNIKFHHAQDLQVFAALQDSRHFHSHQKYRNWWVCRKPWLVILVHILEVPKLIYPQKQTRE